MNMGTLLRKSGGVAALGGAGLFAFSLAAAPVLAEGNPNFDGVIAASSPTGFPTSPASMDVSSGPVSLHFDTLVSNLTASHQSVALNFSADHIVSLNGVNIADGQPGKPGITFNGPTGTVQEEIAGRQAFTLSLNPSEKNQALKLTRTMSACGYYQIDVWAPETSPNDPRHRETLASGFIRVLGCSGTQGSTPTPSPSPTSSVQGITSPPSPGGVQGITSPPNPGGGGGVLGVTSPSTGADIVGPGAGGLALVTVGLGLVVAGARRRTLKREAP